MTWNDILPTAIVGAAGWICIGVFRGLKKYLKDELAKEVKEIQKNNITPLEQKVEKLEKKIEILKDRILKVLLENK